MAQFKCKMCGGNITVSDNQTTATCEFCGTEQTITKIDNEKKVMLFNRANSARLVCDFDKALRNYESILVEFPNDAEAHWGLCLCRYGIEYVNDPRTGKKIPTCHRTLYTSIFDDEDYKEAIKNADVVAKELYKAEADMIDKIQKNIIAISQREEPFDIFICYKETDEQGKRTIDSVIAQDIYEKLIDKGYKVFFSRITLETKIGLQYEPIIFAALQSAKVMLVIGSKVEYFNAVWVKNEWSRFLSFMQTNKNKYLIPCFKDMEAYDMPEEFLSLQAQSIDKLGFMQDLVRGIDKILERNVKTKLEEKTTVVHSDVNVEALLTRIEMLLDDEDWNKADELLEKILNNDPKNSKAYFYKLMIELECGTIEALLKCGVQISKYSEYKKAYDFADTEFKKILHGYSEQINKNIEEKRLNEIYSRGVAHYKNKNYLAAYDVFKTIPQYKDATILAEKCLEIENEKKYVMALSYIKQRRFKEGIAILKQIPDYKDSKEKQIECENLVELERKELIYLKATKSVQGEVFNVSAYKTAIDNLKTIVGYKDSESLINEYSNLILEYQAKEEKEKILRADRKKLMIKISVLVSLVLIAFLILTITVFIPSSKYNDALGYIKTGEYSKAVEIFEDLDNFKDSKNKITFINACDYFDDGKFDQGIKEIFKSNGEVVVRYDCDNGTEIKTEKLSINRIEYEATKEGNTFYGWILKEFQINDVENNSVTITLKASYMPIDYEITYGLGGGTPEKDLINSYTIEQTVTIPNLTKTGYTFAGWYTTDSSNPKTNYVIEKGTKGDIHLYAKWTANTYKITYDADGGTVSSKTQSVTYDSTFSLLTPTKTGYKFVGWYYNNEKINSNTKWNYTKDIKLVAKWEEESYSITYVLDNGVNNSQNISNYTITTSFTFKPATKTGYTFAGWSVNGKTYTTYSISKGTIGNITLTAVWTANSYLATFDANGGSVSTSSKNISYNSSLTIPTPTKTGYTFAGWYYYDDSTSQYKNFSSGTKWTFTKDVTFIASWTSGGKYEYKINYYYENVSTGNIELYDSVSKYASLNSVVTGDLITIDGYTTPDSQSITINQFGNTIDYYYYKAQFTVTYVTNGGNSIQSQKYAFGTNVANRLSTPTRTGYTFGGWYEDAALSNVFDNVIEGNTTLYAYWTEETKTSEFSYSLGSSTCTINSYNGSSTNILVPEYIGGKPVTSISSNCFANKSTIIELVIPDCVTSIGSNILKGCSALKSLTIPFLGSSMSNNSNIGYLFGSTTYSNSYQAEDYYIPKNFTKIEILSGKIVESALSGCSSLTDITIGENVTEINKSALYGCTSLKVLKIPFVGKSKNSNEGYEAVFGYIFGYKAVEKTESFGYNSDWEHGVAYNLWEGKVDSSYEGTIGQLSYFKHSAGQSTAYRTSYYFYIPSSLTKVYITNQTSYYQFAFNGCDSITFVK